MDTHISKYESPNPHWKQLILAVNFFSSRSINENPIRIFVLDTRTRQTFIYSAAGAIHHVLYSFHHHYRYVLYTITITKLHKILNLQISILS
jgi:hypothetical protein